MATKLGVVLGLNAVSSMPLFLGEGGRIEILADSLVQCQGQCPHPPLPEKKSLAIGFYVLFGFGAPKNEFEGVGCSRRKIFRLICA